MKTSAILLIALVLTAVPALAQRDDYLSPEEVKQARETQDPDKRISLFLGFAAQRLAAFEAALQAASGQERPDYDVLQDRVNDFIHAIDDASAALELVLQRGGADLRKTRRKLEKDLPQFLDRVKQAQSNPVLENTDLQYDLEDATIALQDLVEMNRQVPDEIMPVKQPREVEGEQKAPEPGKPTLKRRDEPPEEKKPPR